VSLSCACLSICKDCSIVSRQNRLDNGQCGSLEDLFLQAARLEGHIEAEGSFLLSFIFLVVDDDLSLIWYNLDDLSEVLFLLFPGHGSASDSNLDTLFLSHFWIYEMNFK
jgi:hypothetical protein